jgi:hypothetical protein
MSKAMDNITCLTMRDLSQPLDRDLAVESFAIRLEAVIAKVTPENRHPLLPWGPPKGQEFE